MTIESEVEAFSSRVHAVAPGLLERLPLESHVGLLDAIEPMAPYNYWPEAVRARCDRIREEFGEAALDAYHRLLLVHLVSRFPERAERAGLPDSVRACLESFHERLLVDADRLPDSYFRLKNDRFAKDLAVGRLRWVPAGPEFVVLRSGLPRKRLIQRPWWGIPGRLAFVLARFRGFHPVFETHFDRRLAEEFHEDGYRRFYRRLAELLVLHPDIRGVVLTGSWFMDPALARISPELDYLRERPLAMGGRLVPVETTKDDVRRAIQASPKRRELYDRGEYVPRSYMVLWPRAAILRSAS